MTWVRRTLPAHTCTPPSTGGYPPRPEGQIDDLWRCPCGRLWHIWIAADFSLAWLPAVWWQRARYWRSR